MCDSFWVTYLGAYTLFFLGGTSNLFGSTFFMLLVSILMQIDDEECNHNVKQ